MKENVFSGISPELQPFVLLLNAQNEALQQKLMNSTIKARSIQEEP